MKMKAFVGMIVTTALVFASAVVFSPTVQAGEGESSDPICSLPAEHGPCDGVFQRWYFNTETNICEPFTYGGCGGNANNFESLTDCQHACMDICELPPKYGPCQAAHPRWRFNPDSGGCEQFIWGGCDPNANNFLTLAECEASCGGEVPVCHLPLQQGECDGDPGWYYLPTSYVCKQVPDGWCGTDVNRYATEQECLDACFIPPCWGDLNGDGTVDLLDLFILLADWGSYCPPWHPCPSDLTFDGTVGIQDLLFLLGQWGPCPWPR